MKKALTYFLISLSVLSFNKSLIAKTNPDLQSLENQLLLAAKTGDQKKIKYLIEKKVDVNSQTSGQTPLMAASIAGQEEVVNFLISKGANPHTTLKNGDSSLHMAIRNGHLPVVQLLLKNKVIISKPFTYAMTFQQFEIASYIYSTYIEKALQKGNIEEIKELLTPLPSYKQFIKLPIQSYIDQLSQNDSSQDSSELIALLKDL